MEIKEVEKKDYGVINFGRFAGERWDTLSDDYLRYLISDKCNTNNANKQIAKDVLQQKHIVDGQLSFL